MLNRISTMLTRPSFSTQPALLSVGRPPLRYSYKQTQSALGDSR